MRVEQGKLLYRGLISPLQGLAYDIFAPWLRCAPPWAIEFSPFRAKGSMLFTEQEKQSLQAETFSVRLSQWYCFCMLWGMKSIGKDKKGFNVAVIALAVVAIIGAAAVSRSDTKATASAWDQFKAEPNATPGAADKTPTSDAVKRLLAAIVIVLVVGSAAIWASKKYLPKIAAAKGKNIKLIETVTLAPQRHVHIIEVGTQKFLIGSSVDSVRMLADVTLALTDENEQTQK